MSLWDKRTLNPLLSVPLLSRSAWRRCAPASGSSASAARSSTPNSTRRSWRDCTCRCGSTTPPGPSPTTWWRCSLWRAARAPEHVCVRVSVCGSRWETHRWARHDHPGQPDRDLALFPLMFVGSADFVWFFCGWFEVDLKYGDDPEMYPSTQK